MDRSLQHKIFNGGPCLSKEKLLEYHSGSLSSTESNKVEKHLLDCEMCADALEGIDLASTPTSSLQEIDTQIKILTGTVATGGAFFNWKKGMALAAGITGVLLGVFWLLKDISPKKNIAENAPVKQEEKKTDELSKDKSDRSEQKVIIETEDEIVDTNSDVEISEEEPETETITTIHPLIEEIEIVDELTTSESEFADSDIKIEDTEILESNKMIIGSAEGSSAGQLSDTLLVSESNEGGIAYNWTDSDDTDETAESDYALAEADDSFDMGEETLPKGYINNMLVVDYSEIYNETDPYPTEQMVIKEESRNSAKAEAEKMANRSVPVTSSYEKAKTAEEEVNEDASLYMVNLPYETVLEKALTYYENDQFSISLDYLNEILRKYPEDHNALFYSGMSYLKLEKFDKAIQLFEQVYSLEKTPFKPDAEFNRALALKGSGEKEAAKKLFQKIVSDGGYYSSFAEKELKNL